jgi:hypothetical protein
VTRTRAERMSMEVARIVGLALAEAGRLPLNQARSLLSRAERQALALAATPLERLRIRRRVAESQILVACSRSDRWAPVRRCWAKIEALGFADADRQLQDAVLVARWCLDHGSNLAFALREVTRARRRAARLRRDGGLRVRLLAQADSFVDALVTRGPHMERGVGR